MPFLKGIIKTLFRFQTDQIVVFGGLGIPSGVKGIKWIPQEGKR